LGNRAAGVLQIGGGCGLQVPRKQEMWAPVRGGWRWRGEEIMEGKW